MDLFMAAAVSPYNLPLTVLLGLLFIYWLLVLIGAADADGFLDADLPDGGVFSSILGPLQMSEVPLIAVLSFFAFIAWACSLLCNHVLNPGGGLWRGFTLMGLSVAAAFLITLVCLRAAVRLFSGLTREDRSPPTVLNQVGTVVSSAVTPEFGQVEIETGGAPIRIHARTFGDRVLKKGDRALVFDEDRERGIFFVDKFEL